MTERSGIVRRKRSPGPKVPATREVVIQALKEIAAAHSEERQQQDLTFVLQHAQGTAARVQADRSERDPERLRQAKRLGERVAEMAGILNGGAHAELALCALEVGAILADLDAFYVKEGRTVPSYDDRHFRRIRELISRHGMAKYVAAEQVLKETDSGLGLPDNRNELKTRARNLVGAYDRWSASQS